ncbi:hypothetical protein AB0Q95_36980 [Streptomyces sp. NPDC059900]|uniref:hypothetical protein n=1 Tax=Streptomyces sp. NPDC059900 TaxID=3155816 RepID=UPI0034211782
MTPPPVPPRTAETPAFMAELRRLKAWSGLSYRELEHAAAKAGEVLPYSTAATMLRRDRLPRERVLVAFVVACGLDADGTRRWAAARREIAMGTQPPGTLPAPAAPPPGRRRRPRLRLAVVGVATALAVLAGAGAGAAAFGTTNVQEEQTEVSTHQP